MSYFDDIEFDIEKIASENLYDAFLLKDLNQRKLFINDDIDQCAVHDAVKYILQFNREDVGIPKEERKPILLYVVSNGGEVDSGFELIDAVLASITPVYTINLGYQYSMGFLIGLAGDKRYAMPHAKFLMHDGSNFIYDSGSKAQDRMDFYAKLQERTKEYVLAHSKLTEEEFNSKLRVEWYLLADEAKEKGFVDYIIGEDCDISEVI